MRAIIFRCLWTAFDNTLTKLIGLYIYSVLLWWTSEVWFSNGIEINTKIENERFFYNLFQNYVIYEYNFFNNEILDDCTNKSNKTEIEIDQGFDLQILKMKNQNARHSWFTYYIRNQTNANNFQYKEKSLPCLKWTATPPIPPLRASFEVSSES